MKQVVAGLIILIVVVAGISVATSRSSSAQEQDSPTEITVPLEETSELDELAGSFDEFIECLRDQGVPDLAEGEGRFGFHLDFDTDDLEAVKDAHKACGDVLPFDKDDYPFGGNLPFGDKFGGELPFGEKFGGSFGFGLGEALDLDGLAACLAELGTFENVDEVKAQLEECLPAPIDFESQIADFEAWLEDNGIDGEGFPFGGGFGFFDGPGKFGFDFDFEFDEEFKFESRDVDEDDSDLEGAAA